MGKPKGYVFRSVNPRVWDSADFRSLSPCPASGQGLWLHLLTSKRMSAIPGVIHAGVYSIAEDTRWAPKDIERCLDEIEKAGLAMVDRESRVIWLVKAIHQPENKPASPNHVRKWVTAWNQTHSPAIKSALWQGLLEVCKKLGDSFLEAFHEVFERPSEDLRKTCARPSEDLTQATGKPSRSQEQEQEQEQDPPIGPPSGGTSGKPKAKGKSKHAEAIAEVYAHWRSYHPRSPSALKATSPDARKIRDRLDEGSSVELLKAAIDGCHKTPHNLGENERGTKYLGLNVIMKDASQVTRFAEAAEAPPKPGGGIDRTSKRPENTGSRLKFFDGPPQWKIDFQKDQEKQRRLKEQRDKDKQGGAS